jgi:hypothetical protein
MKNFRFSVLAAVLMLGLAGCENILTGDSDPSPLTFENASRFVVTVYPLTTEWGAFSLAPTDLKEMKDIRDIDYRWEPKEKVQLGNASTDRHIIFVDAPPIEQPATAP